MCKKMIKVTCQVYTWISALVEKSLFEAGIVNFHLQSGRNVVIREKHYLGGLITKTKYENDPADIFRFYIPFEYESAILNYLIKKCEFHHPGRGTVFTEEVTLYNFELLHFDFDKLNRLEKSEDLAKSGFTGISCIIQRGLAGIIIKSVLDMGFCVPTVTYGEGGGFREKLGLIRVAIPSEKEVVTLTVSKIDAMEVMGILVDIARLDQPGKGFIYMFPIRKAFINTRLFRGTLKQVASTEQIIQAIDEIKGNNEWRRKFSESELTKRSDRRKYLKKMINITVFTNEGYIGNIINQAMNDGAGGATVYTLDYKSSDSDYKFVLPAREMSDLVINDNQKDGILQSLINSGTLTTGASGIIETSQVPLVCTYFANHKR